ncbi:MAG: adenosylcobinamide-GDP ribazoletransferase [Snowella sp.]|nr:adenosylcobinamide-GDP ribazoletransferase [Snowella sp.]
MPSFWGSILFYTKLPLPSWFPIEFDRIARWCPVIGLILGASLGGIDWGLTFLGFPPLVRSVSIVALGVSLTGGLHLDGVSDTADGLAVTDPARRLAVMKESTTGAFGVMAIALILLLKSAALSELMTNRGLVLMLAMGWARWGQVAAITFYPYLRSEGKGALHRETFKFPQDLLLGLFFLVLFSAVWIYWQPQQWLVILITTLLSAAIALLTGWWFNRQFGGQTGDTYGAIVEWSEALILCSLTIWFS